MRKVMLMKEDSNGQEAAQDAQREDRPQEPEAQPIIAVLAPG